VKRIEAVKLCILNISVREIGMKTGYNPIKNNLISEKVQN